MLYVGDAGGNALYQVDSKTGAIKLVTVFAGLPAPFPNPSRNNAAELDPVPTGVTVGPDGSIYVGLLSGFPFPQGAAKVVRVALDGTVTDVVTGLTAVVNVTFGPDGHLYIVEFGTFTFAPPDTVGWDANSGRVLRVRDDGTTEVVIDGLDQPYGIAFDKKGNLYVTNRTNYPPEAGPLGEVLRFDGVARKGNQR
jgi:sugar lactone lactonase YvrE